MAATVLPVISLDHVEILEGIFAKPVRVIPRKVDVDLGEEDDTDKFEWVMPLWLENMRRAAEAEIVRTTKVDFDFA